MRMRNRILCAFLAALLLLPAPRADAAELETPDVTAAASPTQSPLPTPTEELEPTPTPAPTEEPTPTPVPTPVRVLTDAYREERERQLRDHLSRFGGLDGDALDARIAKMALDPERPMIALTFDDGPVAGVTDAILDILAANDARATFFVLGKRKYFEATPDLLRKILAEGSEIGSHTYAHINLREANGKQIMDNLVKTDEMVFDATGTHVRLLRPPGGRASAQGDHYAKRFGLAVVLWAQSGNVHEHDPERIAENVFCQIVNGKALADGDIVLLHDTAPRMVDAVAILVPQLIDAGYQLVTVSELIELSEGGFVPGKRYWRQDS